MNENKDLLLKYLCMALPYGVKLFKINEPESAFELYSINKESGEIKYYKYRGKSLEIGDMAHLFRTNDIPRFKPYLRSMSSMTEEEATEYANCGNIIAISHQNDYLVPNPKSINWLLEHHFDFMGLIPKNLAIETPKGMYN